MNGEKACCPTDKKTPLRHYDGALGYEAIFCPKCGYYADMNGTGKEESYIGMSGPEDVYKKNEATA